MWILPKALQTTANRMKEWALTAGSINQLAEDTWRAKACRDPAQIKLSS